MRKHEGEKVIIKPIHRKMCTQITNVSVPQVVNAAIKIRKRTGSMEDLGNTNFGDDNMFLALHERWLFQHLFECCPDGKCAFQIQMLYF